MGEKLRLYRTVSFLQALCVCVCARALELFVELLHTGFVLPCTFSNASIASSPATRVIRSDPDKSVCTVFIS